MKKVTIATAAAALAGVALVGVVSGFKTIPKGAVAVKPFDKQRYMGTWYEIARLDYKWERGLDNVTATYSIQDNGLIRVDNKGYNIKKDKWEESIGKAKPVKDPQEAKLKVSFFGPFYAGYNVIAIDKDYQYALVIGDNTDYMWILSRHKTIPDTIRYDYLNRAQKLGYNIGKLVWVKQDK